MHCLAGIMLEVEIEFQAAIGGEAGGRVDFFQPPQLSLHGSFGNQESLIIAVTVDQGMIDKCERIISLRNKQILIEKIRETVGI